MIDEQNTIRIKGDAEIALEALTAIICAGPVIHENYLREKVKVAQNCLDFMKTFCEIGKEENK